MTTFHKSDKVVDSKQMNVSVNLDRNIGEALLKYASIYETDISDIVNQALKVFLRAHADKLAIRELVF